MNYRDVSNHQKGAIGEALITSHRYKTYDIIRDWVVEDISTHEHLTVQPTDEITVSLQDLQQHQQCHAGTNNELTWRPDARFDIRIKRETEATELSDLHPDLEPISTTSVIGSFTYLFEIKVGKHGSLKRDQKDVMQHVQATENSVIPLRVRVDIDALPDTYGLDITRIHSPE